MDATAHEEQTHDDDADGLDDCYYDSGRHPLNNVDGPEDTGSASVDETSHRPPQAMHLGPAADIEGDTSMHLLNPDSTLQHTRAAYTLPPLIINSPDSQYIPAISVVSPIALPISSSPVLGSPGHPDHPAATMSPPASKSPVSPSSSSSSPSSSRVTLDAHRRLQSTSAPPLQTFSTSSEISTSAPESSQGVRPSSSTVNPSNPSHNHTSASHLPPPRILASAHTTSSGYQDEHHQDETHGLMPDTILPLLRCPLCPFSTLLESPITLHCGHTVCSKHVIRPHASSASFADSPATALLSSIFSSSAPGAFRCPLPTCNKRNAETQPTQVHPESGVNFRPAPPGELPLPHSPGEDPNVPRVDVTVNKILSLTTRTHRSLSSPELVEPMGQNDDDISPEEQSKIHHPRPMIPPSGPSTSLPFPSSDSASHSFPPNPSTPVRRHRSDSCSPPPSPTLPNSPPPRKRRRLPSSVPPSPHRNSPRPQAARCPRPTSDRHALSALFEKELLSELTCEICFALLWQPVTTPCQHTFCSKCLLRSMDHSSACPLCRQELPGYVYAQDLPCNKLVLLIISKAFPISYAERGETIEAEERDSRLDTPIFVCQLSFPGMPTMLHLFEPRYRLMLRRCLAKSNPCFGMIPPPRPTATPASPGNDFGTMLRIKNVQMLPDGRSVVETWGTWRFRIMERGMLDGYVVARVERVEDHEESIYESDEANVEDILEIPTTTTTQAETTPMPGLSVPGSSSHVSTATRSSVASQPTGPPALISTITTSTMSTHPVPSLPSSSSAVSSSLGGRVVRGRSNEELMEICHTFLEQLKQGTPWVVQHLERTIVPMPTDPAQFSFWMALLLPIDEHEKAKLLPIRSPRLRLRLVVHWIEQLRSHWALSYANASRWQVVLWRLRHFVIRFLYPRTRRDRGVVLLVYLALVVAVVVAQVGIWTREREMVESVGVGVGGTRSSGEL